MSTAGGNRMTESTNVPEDETPSADGGMVARRDAIKKAAAGAAVAGAAWAAPRVEGLSVVPDFAAAATLAGTASANMSITYAPGPVTDDFWNNPSGTARVVSAPVPGAGNVIVTIPGGTRADSGATVPFTVSFAGWDPPFNRFTGGNMNFRGRNSTGGRNGPHGFGSIANIRNGGSTIPSPTETSINFSIPSGVNDVGPSPTSNTQWGDLSFSFNFGSA